MKVFLLLLLSFSSVLGVDQTINIKTIYKSNFNNGKFEGFGTSFCWWPNRLGYSDVLAEKSVQLFYDKKGLGLTLIRYNIGGGDGPSHNHITRTDSEILGYWANPKYENGQYNWEYDWTKDFNQRNVLLKCVAKNPEEIIVEVFKFSTLFHD